LRRLVGSKSFPSVLPVSRSARPRLPSGGSLGLHFPTFTGTVLGYDCLVSLSGRFASRSLPDTLSAPFVCVLPRSSLAVGSCLPAPGLLVSRYPSSSGVLVQGDTWLSQVPEFSLWLHALLLDPGGVLRTSPWRTQDCGLPLVPQRRLSLARCRQGYPCGPRLYPFRGSITRPEVLLPPAPYSPHGACTRSSLLNCWLGFAQMGLEPHGLSPTGEH
jgi:hypothetical protein